MKKQMLITAFILSLCSVRVYAQTVDSASKPVKTGDEWRMPGDAVKRSRDFADRLKENLSLDGETTKKVFQAFLANTKPVDEIRVLPLSDKEKANRLKTNQSEFNQTLKGILTPAQFAKYLKTVVKSQ